MRGGNDGILYLIFFNARDSSSEQLVSVGFYII